MLKFKLILPAFFLLTLVVGQKVEKVYLDRNDSTKNCYTLIYPPTLPWKGYLVIIPGFGETAEAVFEQTDLPKTAAQNGLLTILPTLQDGVYSFGIDRLSQETLDQIIEDVRSKHKLMDQPFYIGGFSIGGSSAIKYAENSEQKPQAVFAIDPPLDFERFYYSCQRNIRLSKGTAPNPESIYMVGRIEKEFQGKPETALSNFQRISPYSYSDTTQYSVRRFGMIPLRIYSEPNVNWWIEERNADLTSMNVTVCSAMINELRRLGNADAVLFSPKTKGTGNRIIRDIRTPGVLWRMKN